MNTYLFSIHPKWCEKIFNGEKTIEVRKTAPKPPFKVVVYCTKKIRLTNLDANFSIDTMFIRCQKRVNAYRTNKMLTEWKGKAIGEFICDKVDNYLYAPDCYNENDMMYYIENGQLDSTCLTYDELQSYGKGKTLYGLQITATKLYDKPKELGEFRKPCGNCIGKCTGEHYDRCPWQTITRPPQSYMRIQDPKEERK